MPKGMSLPVCDIMETVRFCLKSNGERGLFGGNCGLICMFGSLICIFVGNLILGAAFWAAWLGAALSYVFVFSIFLL